LSKNDDALVKVKTLDLVETSRRINCKWLPLFRRGVQCIHLLYRAFHDFSRGVWPWRWRKYTSPKRR